jgi:hypothetical protein
VIAAGADIRLKGGNMTAQGNALGLAIENQQLP